MSKLMILHIPKEFERNCIAPMRDAGRADWAQVGPGWIGKVKEGSWVVRVAVGWAGEKSLEQVGGLDFPPVAKE